MFITKLFRHSTGKNSTIIAIMSALGRDCTADFEEVHHGIAMWPTIKAQLESYYIGRVKPPYKADGDTKKNTLELKHVNVLTIINSLQAGACPITRGTSSWHW